MQSKALTNINGHKLSFKCVNFAKENSEMFFFSKNRVLFYLVFEHLS